MAIAIFDKTWSGRTLDGNVPANTRQLTEVYFVMADASSDDEATIRADSRCPKKGDHWESDQFTVLSDIRIRKQGPLSWTLEAVYVGYSFAPNESAVQRLITQPKKRWSTIQSKQRIVRDLLGNPLVNNNGQPLPEPIEIDRADAALSWTGYFQSFDPATIPTYVNTINQYPLTSLNAPAKTARIIGIEASEVEIEGVESRLWEVVVSILFRFDKDPRFQTEILGWTFVVLNQGDMVREHPGVLAGNKLVMPVDDYGKTLPVPVPIGLDGMLAKEPSQLYWLEFPIYKQADWSPLGIS